MQRKAISARVRAVLAFLSVLGLLLVSASAQAAGRVEWKTKELKERSGGSWLIELTFYLPRAPDVAYVPMKFEFQPTAYFERAMMDGDKLVERTVPLDNRQALIESQDVEFLDAGSGKIENRTRFSFKLTRAHGYEAGEYKVTIRDGRNGQTVGAPVTVKFNGENEIIDRRAMVFTGNDKKKKKKDADADAGDAKSGDDKSADDKAASTKSDDSKSDGDDAPASKSKKGDADSKPEDGDDAAENEKVKKKPGGCGCHLEETSSRGVELPALSLLAALAVIGRRRARRQSATR